MLTSRSTQITSSFHRRSKEFGSKYEKRRWWQTSKTKSSKYLMRRPSPVKHHHEIQLNPGWQDESSSQDGSTSLQQAQLQTFQVEKDRGAYFGGIGTILDSRTSRTNIRSDLRKSVKKCLGTIPSKKNLLSKHDMEQRLPRYGCRARYIPGAKVRFGCTHIARIHFLNMPVHLELRKECIQPNIA